MERILIGLINDIDPLGSRKVYMKGMELAIFRLSDGTVTVMENRCPHKNGKLSEGMVCGHVVHCPLHDWKIDMISGNVQAPDHGNVLTFEVEVEAQSGEIYVLWDPAWGTGMCQTG